MMRAALRDKPVVRFVFLAVYFGAFILAVTAFIGDDMSVMGSVIGALVFATLMEAASRYTDSKAHRPGG